MSRTYAADQILGTGNDQRFGMIAWERSSGDFVAVDGRVAVGEFDSARHLHPVTEYPSPRRGVWRSEVRIDGPEGWYSVALIALDGSGAQVVYSATNTPVVIGLNQLYHDPTGRRDSDGDSIVPPPLPYQGHLSAEVLFTPVG